MKRWWMVALGVLVILAAAVVVPVVIHLRHRTPLEQALALAPHDAERYGFTRWSAITKPHDPDETAASGIADLSGVLSRRFGFGPTDLEWELLAGSPDQESVGQVDLLRLPDSFDVAGLAGTLRGLGFAPPASPTGVWDGTNAVTASAGSLFVAVALDPKDHLVRMSDDAAYLGAIVAGRHAGDLPRELDQAAAALGDDPLSAEVDTGGYVCGSLALATLDPASEAQGQQLVAQAGTLNPVLGFGISVAAGGDVLTAMTFADHGQATTNADTRSRLAVGPAVGQSDEGFTAMFALGTVKASGAVVTMQLHPREQQLYADLLSGGPILFATC